MLLDAIYALALLELTLELLTLESLLPILIRLRSLLISDKFLRCWVVNETSLLITSNASGATIAGLMYLKNIKLPIMRLMFSIDSFGNLAINEDLTLLAIHLIPYGMR
eukprot:NODE_101_length_20473_cov_0.516590.p13 type:complete len:108 gc:universal NODE_101_length_20473_cov_0.516590:9159-9482(+)